jgi:hypothetical protein
MAAPTTPIISGLLQSDTDADVDTDVGACDDEGW